MIKERIGTFFVVSDQDGPMANLVSDAFPVQVKMNFRILVFNLDLSKKYSMQVEMLDKNEQVVSYSSNLFTLEKDLLPESSIYDGISSSLISLKFKNYVFEKENETFKIILTLSSPDSPEAYDTKDTYIMTRLSDE